MASKKQNTATSAAKARALATTANWLATVLDGRSAPEIERRIDQAYEVLRFISETEVRREICYMLMCAARPGAYADPVSAVRGFIEATAGGHEFAVNVFTDKLSDETIALAIEAWRTRRGPPPRTAGRRSCKPRPEKWAATLHLLKECGLVSGETAAALRKSWDRRSNRWGIGNR